MNHDREFTRNRLLGLALQIERGQVDHEFAEAEVSIAERRKLIVERIRELAAAFEAAP